ncbi:EF-P beta-lysylation protein EpmB [Marinobacter zhanjiangensis]|uniref:L-lysine 2,3-aminomutase n=1 Tax=Marinobacter zhanjiangensis TaxID=578215 RepID=A0ABQ3B310_9GAMM|nr:EF-P beta-lysylation protein EpmB [Marinobacter zhanjiangensis]GGY75577.1 EF-P beta-lysylation protein EpmB [Marinobacter zhanjiangensis]
MIQRTAVRIEAHNPDNERATWQTLLARSVTRPETLLQRLGLDSRLLSDGAHTGHAAFPVRVPEPWLARIRYGDPADPLLRQVLPLADEGEPRPGFVSDPLQEADATATPGLIRKYRSRALLMVTGQCAINCRYCFRRHFPYEDHRLTPTQREDVISTLTASPEINEVILSGGDPLAVNDRLLAQWASALSSVPSLTRLRIHSRLPVVIPQRVDDALVGWIEQSRLDVVMVVHINHPAEIDDDVRTAMNRLKSAGVTLLNQSVILQGVNDHPDTLQALSEALFAAGILPYYLHAFDPVAGAHHFDVSDDRARAMVRELQARLPGYLVPRLVRELPGRPGKTLLDVGME